MTQGDVQSYGPYPLPVAAAALQADSSNGIVPDADIVTATPVGNGHIFYTVVKKT